MQIVIDIPNEIYDTLQIMEYIECQDRHLATDILKRIKNGTPLPELEQEPVLDKIRAEIELQEKWLMCAGYNAYNVDIAFSSIKSVLTEGEDKE